MEVLDLDTIPATTTASASLDVLSELLENTRLQGWIAEESPITARLSRPRFCDRPNEPEQRKASRGPGAAMSALVGPWMGRNARGKDACSVCCSCALRIV